MIIANDLLTFTELESFAGFWLSGFLPFHFAGIAGGETFSFQLGLVLRINFDQGPGNSETYRLCLTFKSTAVKGDSDVIFVGNIEKVKGLENNILKQL